MGTQPLILDSIILHFGQREVLHGVYMALESTTVYGLYGLNGSGKTTLMKVVMGILAPDSGTVFIQGIPQAERTIRERFSKIGYLPQGTFMPNDIGVARLVRQFPLARGLFNEFSTLGHARKTVGELSTGLRRYLEIRLILSLDRPIVLLDEPFTGLEPILIERVVQDIRSTRNAGRTILLTDHYHQYVEGAVDERFHLAGGRCRPLSSVDDARTEMSRTK